MRASRILLFAAGTLAVAAQSTRGQSSADVAAILKPYAKSVDLGPQTQSKARQMMNGQLRVLKTPDEAKNLEYLDELARHYVYKLTQEEFYNTGSDSGELVARRPDKTLDGMFTELRQYLLRPDAASVAKMTVDQADYIKEFGAALDRALQPLLKVDAKIVRVNAGRMLAVVSASGAAAHAKTVAALLNDPKTPPEVLIHAYQAAEAFLAAYDAYAVGRADANRHAGDPADVIALVQALQKHIVFGPENPNGPVADKAAAATPPPAPPAPTPPAGGETPPAEPAATPVPPTAGKLDTTALTPEQMKVVRYFRRHAVKALAEVRFDILGGRSQLPEVRPAFTLAQVAISDKAVNPPPEPAECAEAVIGLCGMNLSPSMSVDVLADAMAHGVIAFATVKNLNLDDRTLPWRLYASRLSAAFNEFKASVKANPKANASQGIINSLSDAVLSAVVSRLDVRDNEPLTRPDVERIRAWVQQNPPKDANRQLFADSARDRLNPRPQ